MSFANGKLAKVWEVKPKEKFTEVKLSTSKKKEDGSFEQDFSSFVRFIGKAHEKVKDYTGNEYIKLLSVETTNRYVESKKQVYYNFCCFDFEKYEPSGKSSSSCRNDKNKNEPLPSPDDDVDLPF